MKPESKLTTGKKKETIWELFRPYVWIGSGFWAFLLSLCAVMVIGDVRRGRLSILRDIPEMIYGTAGISLVGVSLLGAAVLVARALGDEKDVDSTWYHGTSRFAREEELGEFFLPIGKRLPPGGFYLGPTKDGSIYLPRSIAVKHGMIIGGPGTGKTRGYSLPNAAWSGGTTSLVLFDPKYELFNNTSGCHRRSLRYAPTDPAASECFNWISLCKHIRLSELCARALLESKTKPHTEPYWIDGEVALLSALFSHTATLAQPTPLTTYRLLTRQTDDQLEEQLMNSASDAAREQALIFYHKTEPKHRHSFVTGVVNALQFMRDPEIARFTSAEVKPPQFGRLRREPTAVYYCLREQDITRLQSLTSLFFTLVLEQLAAEELKVGEQGVPVTMMLDEFANLGKIPDFASTISLSRGRDIAIWIYVQEISQLAARYGRDDAQTIMGTCSTKVALNGLDVRTAEYVSKMLGDATVVAPRKSYNDGGGILGKGSASTTYTKTEHRRPLLTPDEVMRIGEDQALVRTGNRHPMWLWKIHYNGRPMKAKTRELGQARALDLVPTLKKKEASARGGQVAPPPAIPPSA